MLDLSLDRALGIFRTRSSYVSTVLGVCFYNARETFGRARGPSYVSTVLGVCSDRARVIFRLCSKFFTIVLKVCFDGSQSLF